MRCEICGSPVDTRGRTRYRRMGSGAQVEARGPRRCSECRRSGCPSCLRVVEGRADDFFFEEFLCAPCLEREEARCLS